MPIDRSSAQDLQVIAEGYRELAPSPKPLLRLGAMAKAGHTAH